MRRVHASLEWRLLRHLALLFAGCILVYAGSVLTTTWLSGQVELDEQMAAVAGSYAISIMPAPDGGTVLKSRPQPVEGLDGQASMRFGALDPATGRITAGSDPSLRSPLVAFAEAGGAEASFAYGDNQVVLRRLETPAGPMLVGVDHGPPSNADRLRFVGRELSTELLPTLVPLLLATLALTAITLRRTLRPVARLSDAARAILPGEGRLLDGGGVPGEIAGLVGAVNQALGTLHQALASQRRFTANAAHELRTPLAVLAARVDGLDPGPGRDQLASDVARMARLVDQLLEMARLEGAAPLPRQPVELAALTRRVLADMALLAHAKGKDVALEAATPLTVQGNAGALETALRNLVDNALGHSPAGGVVEVSLLAAEREIRIAVCDRGPGLPPGDPARLLEPFWRAADQRRAGTGLGLAIAAEAMRALGGQVQAANRAGGGATFTLVLPADA